MSNLDRAALLKDYIQEEPENPFNYYALALEIKDIDPNQAQELFTFLLNSHPQYLPVYFTAAQFFFDQDQLEMAQKTYLSGIQLAENQGQEKALKELKGAYQNFLFETDLD